VGGPVEVASQMRGRRLRDALFAVASGWLLALAFPKPAWSACAWFALVPLLAAIDGSRPAAAFRLGWFCGFSFFLVTLDWIPGTISRVAALPPLLGAGVLLPLAATLGLVPGCFAAGVRFWESRTGRDGMWLATALWTGLEWCRSSLSIPVPWNLLGYTQVGSLPLLQLTEVTGIYGLGALIVAVNFALYTAAARRRPASFHQLRLAGVALLCLFLYVAGSWRLAEVHRAEPSRRLRVGLVQPAIDPLVKWDPERRAAVIGVEEALSREAVARGAQLVVWPEASAPYVFAADSFYDSYPRSFVVDRELRDRMIAFVRDLGVPLLFGSPVVEVSALARGEVWNSINRSFLLSPEGRVVGQYDKMILVPFGEYVPMQPLLSFVDKLVPGVGNFLPGFEPTIFQVGDARFAVLICYEAIFPDFVRGFVHRGAAFLVNQTNDAWFGDTAAPLQHFAMAIVRAVENRVPLVRVANTGISAVVDLDGTIETRIPLLARGVEVVEIGLREGTTFYTRHGDLFAEVAALAALALLMYAGWMPAAPRPLAARVGEP